MIESNRQRAKTNEQVGREAQALLAVEAERAKRRQIAAAVAGNVNRHQPEASPVKVILPEPSKGQARDKVGEQLGISGSKAERAATVVKTIDTLKAEGKAREAEQLRATLNGKSVQRTSSEMPAYPSPVGRPVMSQGGGTVPMG